MPVVNNRSSELDRKLQERRGDKENRHERWEELYRLNEKMKAQLETRQKAREVEKQLQEQFPFKPQLLSQVLPANNAGNAGNAGSAGSAGSTASGSAALRPMIQANAHTSRGSVERRTRLWNQRRADRLQTLKEEEAERELDGCTFHPQRLETSAFSKDTTSRSCLLSSDRPAISDKSIDRHIERQRQIREAREGQQKKADRSPGSGER